jgi:hypothetical protein
MKQDIERSKKSIKKSIGEIAFPAIAYIENEDGEIVSALLMFSSKRQSVINEGKETEITEERLAKTRREVTRTQPGTQSKLMMFFVESALPSDFTRITEKALAYKKQSPSNKKKN